MDGNRTLSPASGATSALVRLFPLTTYQVMLENKFKCVVFYCIVLLSLSFRSYTFVVPVSWSNYSACLLALLKMCSINELNMTKIEKCPSPFKNVTFIKQK